MSKWILYIVKCSDGSLYTGISTNLKQRLKRHNEGRATKYTCDKKPVTLLYSEKLSSEGKARRREIQVKKLSRVNKLKLIYK